jgi:hypothetical protein
MVLTTGVPVAPTERLCPVLTIPTQSNGAGMIVGPPPPGPPLPDEAEDALASPTPPLPPAPPVLVVAVAVAPPDPPRVPVLQPRSVAREAAERAIAGRIIPR